MLYLHFPVLQVIPILFGAACTLAACGSLGSVLLHRLPVKLYREEAALFSFLAGSACLQVVMFTLCLFHAAQWGVFAFLTAGAISGAVFYGRKFPGRKSIPRPPQMWMGIFAVVYAAFFAIYLANAMAPEVSADGSGYHLGNVFRMWQQHGFDWNYHSIYSHMPQGMEMLFLLAYSFGGTSAAALIHLAFFSILPLLMVCYGCRFECSKAALFGAILVYAAPVCGLVGTSAYNDLALATLIFAVFYAVQANSQDNTHNNLLLIGLLIGECFALKYTGALVAPFAVTLLFWDYRGKWMRPVVLVVTAAAIVAVPWLLRNWIWLGNPVAPFLNAWFPNPYYTTDLERGYLAGLREYPHFKHYWDLPLDFILFGRVLPGFIGPGFLLAPFALLSLRKPQGRRLVFAASVFAIPIFLNAAVRFLVPSLAFLGIAIGIGMTWSEPVMPALAVFHAVLCWPSMTTLYCAPWAWRLAGVPVRAALRLEPESQFLAKRLGDYAWKDPIEHQVPPNALTYTDAGRPEAYIHRTLVVSYESTAGFQVQQTLWEPLANPALRAASIQKIRELGISYILINNSNSAAADLKSQTDLWGIRLLQEVNGARLYSLSR